MAISEITDYLLKVCAIQGVFIGLYGLLFNRRTSYRLNRFYLLGTLIFSLVVPFIQTPFSAGLSFIPGSGMGRRAVELQTVAQPVEYAVPPAHSFSLNIGLFRIYLGLVIFFLVRSFLHLYALQKIRKESECVSRGRYKLFKTNHSSAFSFFRSVFIPKTIFGSSSFDQILAHECTHVRQLHSLDRMLVDFLVSLLWFNPFIYLYRKAFIEVHEFEADAEVIRQFNDPVGYQEILFAQLLPTGHSGLVSHFNFSTVKKRIIMMNKSKNTKGRKLIYMLSLPVLSIVILAFTAKKETGVTSVTTSEIEGERSYQDFVLPGDTNKRSKSAASYEEPAEEQKVMEETKQRYRLQDYRIDSLGRPVSGPFLIAIPDGEEGC